LNLIRIIITGAPGTGKTSIINSLKSRGYTCFDEYSRGLINWGYKNGIKNFFLDKPNTFNFKILKGRVKQYKESERIKKTKDSLVFFDRGVYDVFAYQKFINPLYVLPKKNNLFNYQKIFILNPWSEIYINDDQRFESYETSKSIHKSISSTYDHFGFKLNEVPKLDVEKRVDFIINRCL